MARAVASPTRADSARIFFIRSSGASGLRMPSTSWTVESRAALTTLFAPQLPIWSAGHLRPERGPKSSILGTSMVYGVVEVADATDAGWIVARCPPVMATSTALPFD